MKELRAVLGKYPHTQALKTGRVTSDRVSLRFVDYDPVWAASDAMCNEQAFDICELALVASIQAICAGRRLRLLPIVMLGGIHHDKLWQLRRTTEIKPADLPGKRIAVRSYSQTTGMWVRNILSEEYRVDTGAITWVTTEAGHVSEYRDPGNVERAPIGATPSSLLVAGDVDAVLGAPDTTVDGKPILPSVHDAQLAWYEKHGLTSINHMVAFRDETFLDHEASLIDVHRMLTASMDAGAAANACAFRALGLPNPIFHSFDRIATSVNFAINASYQQGLIPRRPNLREIFPQWAM